MDPPLFARFFVKISENLSSYVLRNVIQFHQPSSNRFGDIQEKPRCGPEKAPDTYRDIVKLSNKTAIATACTQYHLISSLVHW